MMMENPIKTGYAEKAAVVGARTLRSDTKVHLSRKNCQYCDLNPVCVL